MGETFHLSDEILVNISFGEVAVMNYDVYGDL